MRKEAKVLHYETFENINGRFLSLQVHKYDGAALEIILEKSPYHFRKKLKLFLYMFAGCLSVLLSALVLDYRASSLLYILILMLIAVTVCQTFSIQRESLLIVKSLGYQIEKRSFLGKKLSFIPWEDVTEVFINEVVTKQRVVFILVMHTKDCTTTKNNVIVPLFTDLLPRLHFLETIYKAIQDI